MTAPDPATSDDTFDGPALSGGPVTPRTVTPAARALRPFGYLGLSVVWLAITAVVLLLLVAIPAALAGEGPLSEAPGMAALAVDNQWIAALIVVPLFAVIFGTVVFLLAQGSLSLFVLSLVALSRSLRPSFAGEPLTTTRWTGEAIGPVRLGSAPAKYAPVKNMAALSLIPVRRTRFSAFWTAGMLFAFAPSFRVITESAWVGLAYFITVGWVMWPVTGPLAIVLAVVSAALAVFGVWRVIRARRVDTLGWTTQAS
ncbi:hypothetical protein ABIE21_000050 [Conyzicola nivalis]|uniref:Uncharacterized protein n=1 Tax=Conyzicola nivalis TaxID=1477021 RepID=A0ABV2QIW7_9MICO